MAASVKYGAPGLSFTIAPNSNKSQNISSPIGIFSGRVKDIILDEENPKLEITNYLTTNNININDYITTMNNNRNFEENLYFINGELKIINMYDFLAFIPQENK